MGRKRKLEDDDAECNGIEMGDAVLTKPEKLPPADSFGVLFSRWEVCASSDAEQRLSVLQSMHQLCVDSRDSSTEDGRPMLGEVEVTKLLGACEASLTASDQLILLLLRLAERRCRLNMAKFSPLVWGELARERYADLKAFGASLFIRPSAGEVVDALDARRLWYSAIRVPLQIESSAVVHAENEQHYDPRFLLPLLAQLTAADSAQLDARRFVEQNCLAFALCCLSCDERTLRSLAYLVLTRFNEQLKGQQLPGARFAERPQFVYLLSLLRNSVTTVNQRLPNVVSHFLARVSKLLLHAEDGAYGALNAFLLLKPALSLDQVPEMTRLLNSASVEQHVRERHWMLQLLADALRQPADYRLVQKRGGFKLLLGLFDSALAEQRTRALVLQTVRAAVALPVCAADLCRRDNLAAWLLSAGASGRASRWELGFLVDILALVCQSVGSSPLLLASLSAAAGGLSAAAGAHKEAASDDGSLARWSQEAASCRRQLARLVRNLSLGKR